MRSKNFSDKSALEQALLTGLRGTPELKREERSYFLGQYRERVIQVLTFQQVAEPGTYPETKKAITHPKATRLLISRKANLSAAAEYIGLARKYGLSFTTIDRPEFKGSVGLVVAADEAVDQEEITVPDRTQRLLSQGIPVEVIQARGRGLCRGCMELLRQNAPEEVGNYRKLNFIDRIVGNQCPCKKK